MVSLNDIKKLLPLSVLLTTLSCSQESKVNIGKPDHCPENDTLTDPDGLPQPSLELSLSELGDFDGSPGYVVAQGQELVFNVVDVSGETIRGWLFYYNRETEIIREIFSPNQGNLLLSSPFQFVDNYLTFVTRRTVEIDDTLVRQLQVYLYNITEDRLVRISQDALASDFYSLLSDNFLFYQSSSLAEGCNQRKELVGCKKTVIYDLLNETKVSFPAPPGFLYSVFKEKVGYLSKKRQIASVQDMVSGEIENYSLPQTIDDNWSNETHSGTDPFSFHFPYVFFDRQTSPNIGNRTMTAEEELLSNYDLFRYDVSAGTLREFAQGVFTTGNHPIQKDDTVIFNGFRRDECDWQDLNAYGGHNFGHPYMYNISNDTFQQLYASPRYGDPQVSISNDKIAFSVVGDETKIVVIDRY